jgi:hypothetical protein
VGLSSRAIGRRVESGDLIPVHAGVYAVGYVRVDPLSRAAAAVLACGEDAILSHESAAALWGMGTWPAIPEVIACSRRRRPGIHTHRCPKLTRRDITHQRGIRTTSPARTTLDIALKTPIKQLIRAVNDAENAGWLRRNQVIDVLKRNPGHKGAPKLRYVVGLDPTRSGFEDDFPADCVAVGLPKPSMNAIVAGYVVDALFPEPKVIIELDSWAHHRDRASFESNRERDAATLDAGFVTVRLTWGRWQGDRRREAGRLHRILQQREP